MSVYLEISYIEFSGVYFHASVHHFLIISGNLFRDDWNFLLSPELCAFSFSYIQLFYLAHSVSLHLFSYVVFHFLIPCLVFHLSLLTPKDFEKGGVETEQTHSSSEKIAWGEESLGWSLHDWSRHSLNIRMNWTWGWYDEYSWWWVGGIVCLFVGFSVWWFSFLPPPNNISTSLSK